MTNALEVTNQAVDNKNSPIGESPATIAIKSASGNSVMLADQTGGTVMVLSEAQFLAWLPAGIMPRYQHYVSDGPFPDSYTVHLHSGTYKRLSKHALCGTTTSNREWGFGSADHPYQGHEYTLCDKCANAIQAGARRYQSKPSEPMIPVEQPDPLPTASIPGWLDAGVASLVSQYRLAYSRWYLIDKQRKVVFREPSFKTLTEAQRYRASLQNSPFDLKIVKGSRIHERHNYHIYIPQE